MCGQSYICLKLGAFIISRCAIVSVGCGLIAVIVAVHLLVHAVTEGIIIHRIFSQNV